MTGSEYSNRHRETGQRIRRLRESTGLSQERFAPRVGITRRHLIRLENGEHRPSRELAARIEEAAQDATGEPSGRILDEDDDASAALHRDPEFLEAVLVLLERAGIAERVIRR